jgi:pantetheine-phosphate adenylyltransferase
MLKRAIYPGSFDTLTLGHLNIIERAARLFEHVIVAIGDNPSKKPLFAREERMKTLRAECARFENVEVAAFDGLMVDFARANDIYVIIRGLRAVSDFEYELQIAIANRHLSPQMETIFLPPEPTYSFLSSSVVKEIARLGGDVSDFAPKSVARALRAKFADPSS